MLQGKTRPPSSPAPIVEFPDEKWDAIMAINLSSAFHATKLVLLGMRERGWGRVING